MRDLRVSERLARRLLAGAGAIAVAAGLSGVALAADASGTATKASAVIKGCFNSQTGALRVVTPHSKTCGSESKISWNEAGPAGPAGNGFAFVSTAGGTNKYDGDESDGQVVTKSGTYFVNFTGTLNISAYTSGGSGFCALDLAKGTTSTKFVFGIFSQWSYPAAAANISNEYPFASSGMIHVASSHVGYQLILECFDNSFSLVPVSTATWRVSRVTSTKSATASLAGHSTLGPAGFRPKPALKH